MTISAEVLKPDQRGSGYTCTWFNKGDLKSAHFPEEVLEPCSERGPALA